jgi:hypothetical protein
MLRIYGIVEIQPTAEKALSKHKSQEIKLQILFILSKNGELGLYF